jgi:hypothetical protein
MAEPATIKTAVDLFRAMHGDIRDHAERRQAEAADRQQSGDYSPLPKEGGGE